MRVKTLLYGLLLGAISTLNISTASADDVRTRLHNGDANGAYQLAIAGSNRSTDSLFMAGFLALRKLNDPTTATTFFVRYGHLAKTRSEKAKTLYWLAEAAKALGDANRAIELHRSSSAYGETFYGQASSGILKIQPDPQNGSHTPNLDRLMGAVEWPWVRAAVAAGRRGDFKARDKYLSGMGGKSDIDTLAISCKVATALGAANVAAELSERAKKSGYSLGFCGYPDVEISWHNPKISKDLVLAVIREESRFKPAAASSKQARGSMQVTDIARRDVEQAAGISIDPGRVASDHNYNVAVGSTYLVSVAKQYSWHPILAIAAYNAGPGSVGQWVSKFGDPRNGMETVDWIEQIPFSETRNYVKAVFASYVVYTAKRRTAG